MGLFWNRHVDPPPATGTRLADVEAEVASLKQRVVRAEQTVSDLAERAYKYMKKAEARARRELDESGAAGQGEAGPHPAGVVHPSATPSGSRRVWGARSRWGRRRTMGRSDPLLEVVSDLPAAESG